MTFKYKKESPANKRVKNGGYYILLGICLMLTGSMWYIAASRIPSLPKEVTSHSSSPRVVSEYVPPAITTPPQVVPTAQISDTDYAIPVSASPQQPSVTLDFMPPTPGEIMTDYARETLAYSNTMQDWRCHEAIDYRGEIGSQVKASESGVIEQITIDEMQGTTITVRHSDNVLTRYSGLQEKVIVLEGQEVKKGDIIGGIGVSGAFEIADPPHLHFELIVDGKNINPHEVLD